MRPKIFENVWASSGDTGSPPNAAKKIVGWLKEQVPHERWNYLQNRTENRINAAIQEGPGSWYPQASDVNAMITTGLWDESWGITSDTANVIDGGAAKKYRDLAVYFDSNDEPRLMVLDNANCKIEVWDPRTLAVIVTTDALTNDLPSGGSPTWEVQSFCTDGTDVFVTFVDTNASPEEHQIQAWTINESSSNWSVKTGWDAAAGGAALQGTGSASGSFRETNVIIADDDNLAVACGYVAISADTDPAIQLIDRSDGSAVRDGAGDCGVASSLEPTGEIISDGTNLYFTTSVATSKHLCSATITDLTAGTGGTGYPLGIGGATSSLGCLVQCGGNMFFSASGDTAAADTDTIARTFESGDAAHETLTFGQSSQATPLDGMNYIMEYPLSACFDGMNIWVFGIITPTGGDTAVLIKIDAARLNLRGMNNRQLSDVVGGVYSVSPDVDFPTGSANWIFQRCVFDGRDIWVNIEPRASQTNSGKIFRLPMAMLRS